MTSSVMTSSKKDKSICLECKFLQDTIDFYSLAILDFALLQFLRYVMS